MHCKFGRKVVTIEMQVLEVAPTDIDGLIGKNHLKSALINFAAMEIRFAQPSSQITEERLSQNILRLRENSKIKKQSIKRAEEVFPRTHTNESEDVLHIVRNAVEDRAENALKCFLTSRQPILEDKKDVGETRVDIIMNSMPTNHLSDEDLIKVRNLVDKFNSIFKLKTDKLGACTLMKCRVPLKDESRVSNVKQYKMPKSHEDEAEKIVQGWLREGIAEISISPFNSPIIVVPKKTLQGEKRFRVVIDLRKLNLNIIDAQWNQPSVHEILRAIPKVKYMASIDLSNGYFQVELDQRDRHKFAFTVKQKHYQMSRMAQGAKTSAACFNHILTRALEGINDFKYVFVYLDDICIFAETKEELFQRIEAIFERFKNYNLKINPQKFEMLLEEIIFLGHKISYEGILPEKSKVDAIQKMPLPRNIKEVQSVLATFSFFREHIPDLAKISFPLTKLLRKNEQFLFTSECVEAFEKIKSILTSEPLLCQASVLEKPENKAILVTDASQSAIGASLLVLINGEKLHAIAYSSKILNRTQANWSTFEKEYYSVVTAVTKDFAYLLLEKEFTILTDHQALINTTKAALDVLSPKLCRWSLRLQNYKFRILYLKGRFNIISDLLSRLVQCEAQDEDESENCYLLEDLNSFAVLRSETRKKLDEIRDGNIASQSVSKQATKRSDKPRSIR